MKLPVRQIHVSDSEWAKLQKDVYRDDYVSAYYRSGTKMLPIKLRFRGGHTRDYPKKSFDISMGGRVTHLNAEYDDPSLIRNALSFRFFRSIGVPSPAARHCLVKLNDRSFGVYLEIESVNAAFFRKKGIQVLALFYAVNDDANFRLTGENDRRKKSLFDGYESVYGGKAERLRLIRFIEGIHRRKGRFLYEHLQRHLDVDGYLRWLAGAVLTGNYDGFDQNYAIHRHAKSGRYAITPWDYEGTWGRNCFGVKVESDLVRVKGYNGLTEKVLQFKPYRQAYLRLLKSILRTNFRWEKLESTVLQMHNMLEPYVREDTMRKWGHRQFLLEPEVIREYVEARTEDMKEAIRNWE